jgi:uncharacterized glyoxalase superfamily protein PhnB
MADGPDTKDMTPARAASDATPAVRCLTATPILRIFDVAKAKEFYLGYLGFAWDWDHRFDDRAPLYAQISRDGLVLHLSEHHGDGSPGVIVQVTMRGVDAFHREISSKGYGHMRPGLEDHEWGRGFMVWDPFGNRLRFNESKPA